MDIIQKIKNIREKIEEEFDNVNNLEELEEIRIKYLGKKGKISKIFSAMSEVEDEKKPIVGRETNQLKQKIEKLHKEKEDLLDKLHKKEKLKEEQIDVTLPGIKPEVGHAHPLTLVIEEVIDLFAGMGFTIEEGPEVESEYYNFEALNIPKGHPARDLQDTFYIDNKFLLRTHTSPVQVRTMENKDLPIRIIAPGRAYRSDELDASHSPMFHQIEGLVIDHDISFSDLKGSINTFVHKLYGEKRKIRFRPSYFPFTEPSAEVDVSCVVCDGKGCKLCSNTGWLEIMGS
ncbi:MAG: phenylalanine--tRNA ligase subunit alpha, partial [Bacillota bacterium]